MHLHCTLQVLLIASSEQIIKCLVFFFYMSEISLLQIFLKYCDIIHLPPTPVRIQSFIDELVKLTSISVLALNLSVVIVQRLQVFVAIHCSSS